MSERNMQPLQRKIIKRIDENGAITVAEYMNIALGDLEHGYYMTQEAFGVKGDFTTAPEMSQMFGEVIGAWFADLWMQMGKPENIQWIELGPGRGTLSADVLRVLKSVGARPSVHLVEMSPRLRDKQAELLKDWQPKFYDRLENVPEGASFIMANEFFDALPIHQFEKTKQGWQERRVSHKDGKLAFVTTKTEAQVPDVFLNAKDQSIFEVSPVSLSMMETICRRLNMQGGAGLVIDYGHAEAGLADTLQAVSRHGYADVLLNAGTQDLTAHVDFGTLKALASDIVNVHGVAGQGEFLKALGIVERGDALRANANKEQRKAIETALYRLISPSEMGTLFKVMGLTPKDSGLKVAGL